jgi:trehalose-6-phosphate synthase
LLNYPIVICEAAPNLSIFGDHALLVNPWDSRQCANAIYTALVRDQKERSVILRCDNCSLQTKDILSLKDLTQFVAELSNSNSRQCANAIYTALVRDQKERKKDWEQLHRLLLDNSATNWVKSFRERMSFVCSEQLSHRRITLSFALSGPELMPYKSHLRTDGNPKD